MNPQDLLQPVIAALTQLAQTLLYLALPILVGFATRWLHLKAKEAVTHLKENADRNGDWMIDQATTYAVKIAEQTLKAGSDKKQFAVDWAEKYLEGRGVAIDLGPLADIIESKVWDEFNSR